MISIIVEEDYVLIDSQIYILKSPCPTNKYVTQVFVVGPILEQAVEITDLSSKSIDMLNCANRLE